MMFDREFYRPKDARVEYPEGLPGAEIHRYENGSRAPNTEAPFAAVFGGKRTKPDWHFRFSTPERREAKIAEWLEQEKGRLESAAERRKAHNAGHSLKVGDVLDASWGYDQTNVDFYQVTEVPSKCFVMLRKVCAKAGRESSPPCDYVRPDVGNFVEGERGEPMRRKASGESVTIDSVRHASKTDPNHDHYQTSFGWGH